MRAKSKSVQVQNILKPLKLEVLNYNDCIFECKVLRKRFVGLGTRYLYIFPNQVAICKVRQLNNIYIYLKSPYKNIPDRQIPINYETRVSWTFTIRNDGRSVIIDWNNFFLFSQTLKSLKFHVIMREYEYFGEDKVMHNLKEQLSRFIFQSKIQEIYQAEIVIDKGNYATVLELKNIWTQQSVAAKCIDQKKIQDKFNATLQLQYEIQTMRLLSQEQHPNILKLHELFIGSQNYYIIMEIAKGGSLLSVMKHRNSLFNSKEIKIIMKQLLQGLVYMHSYDLMHRDLKPDNLLFIEQNNLRSLKIADFGLAQSIHEHPYIYPKCGTPGFVAPEVLAGTGSDVKYDCKCDVFSAGVIYYLLLTGEQLFVSHERNVLLELNKKCEIDFQNFDQKLINKQDLQLLMKMLCKNPQERATSQECLDYILSEDEELQQFSDDFYNLDNEYEIQQQINLSKFSQRQITFKSNPFLLDKNKKSESNNK